MPSPRALLPTPHRRQDELAQAGRDSREQEAKDSTRGCSGGTRTGSQLRIGTLGIGRRPGDQQQQQRQQQKRQQRLKTPQEEQEGFEEEQEVEEA